jgi:peptide/nickel transport system permease protein
MVSTILGRLVATIPVLLTVAATVFLLLRLGLGDPAPSMTGDTATSMQIAAIHAQFGLDQPIWVQFASWLGRAARGDLGTSFYFRVPVADLLGERFGPTVSLAALTLMVAVAVGVPLGVAAAHWRGGSLDRTLMGFAVIGFSAPSFVVSYALIYVFAVKLGWFPVQGYAPLSSGVGAWFSHLFLPVLSLAPIYIAIIGRMTRASVADTLAEEYMRTAYAKGATPLRVLLRHALPNAAAPILTVIGTAIGLLMGGVVVTESVFNLPGLGRLMIDSVLAADFPVVQGTVLASAVIYLAANLAIDIAYGLIDPRVRT